MRVGVCGVRAPVRSAAAMRAARLWHPGARVAVARGQEGRARLVPRDPCFVAQTCVGDGPTSARFLEQCTKSARPSLPCSRRHPAPTRPRRMLPARASAAIDVRSQQRVC